MIYIVFHKFIRYFTKLSSLCMPQLIYLLPVFHSFVLLFIHTSILHPMEHICLISFKHIYIIRSTVIFTYAHASSSCNIAHHTQASYNLPFFLSHSHSLLFQNITHPLLIKSPMHQKLSDTSNEIFYAFEIINFMSALSANCSCSSYLKISCQRLVHS